MQENWICSETLGYACSKWFEKNCSVYNPKRRRRGKGPVPIPCVLCRFWEIPSAAKQAGISHFYSIASTGLDCMYHQFFAGEHASLLRLILNTTGTGTFSHDQTAWDEDARILIPVPFDVLDQ
jgi:hypothetical protein